MAAAFCRTVYISVRCLKLHTLTLAAHLSIPTFGPSVHLAVVFGVVLKESCLAVTDPDHAAVGWVGITAMAEELPTKHVLLLAGDVLVFYTSAEGVVGSSGVMVIAFKTALCSTWSIQFETLVRPLWTLAVVAVSQVSIAWEAIHRKDILRTGGALPIAVLCQITFILLSAALRGSR